MIDKEQYLQSEHLLARCSRKLLESALYSKHSEYVRLQTLYVLLQVPYAVKEPLTWPKADSMSVTMQEDDPPTLHLIASFLLFNGRQEEQIYELMNAEGVFIRLVELTRAGVDDGLGLHRTLLELLYEMSRIQRISQSELGLCCQWFSARHLLTVRKTAVVDDSFVLSLFQIIEGLSNDVNDPYHYPTIRVLVS